MKDQNQNKMLRQALNSEQLMGKDQFLKAKRVKNHLQTFAINSLLDFFPTMS